MIKRILVPVDFSVASLRGLDYAVRFAQPLRAELAVLFVVEPVYTYGTPTDLYGPVGDIGWLIDEQTRAGRERLTRLAADLHKRRVRVHTLLRFGRAADVIVNTAKRLKTELIIMTTHGRSGLSHLLLGSVTERVVRLAACPVLTVRPSAARPVKDRPGRRAKP